MKILPFILILISTIAFVGCNEDKIAQLEAENQNLKEITLKKDSSISGMLSSFNEIQSNLKEIKNREGIIQVKTNNDEITQDLNGIINEDIELISELMKRNEELIQKLNQDAKNSKVKMREFRTLIANLNESLKSKNQEIANLNEELKEKKIVIGQLYFSVDSLTFTNRRKDNEINDKIDQLNEAYYAFGTYKELKEKNVLTKEGGFLGLGKNEELKDNFNKEYFSKIDKRKQKSFLIYADKAELITKHPTGSYKMMGDKNKVDSLVILNSEDFWRATNYLVIVVD